MNYDSVTDLGMSYGDGQDNQSGVGEQAFFIPISFFAAAGIKKPVPDDNAASLVTISVAHVLAAGKAVIPVTPLFKKSGANWKLVGEELSGLFETGVDIFVPDNSAKSLGSAGAIKTYRGILLIAKNDGSGHFWQIGSELMTAKVIAADGGTGVGPTGEVGTKVTFQAHSTQPIFVYTAGIPVPAA